MRKRIGNRFRRQVRRVLVPAFVVVTMGAWPAAAWAESCVYDSAQKRITAQITPGGEATLMVVGTSLYFGQAPGACLGATTTNTDSVTIAGAAGTLERLTLDERGGVFGPGATAETNTPEIEITTTLGDAEDTIVVYGTEGADWLAPGQFGMALNTDGDVDVTFSPAAFPLEIHGLGGNDYINGRGEGGAGLHFLGPLKVYGGDGDDLLLRGSSEPDVIEGGPGNDDLEGRESRDLMDGGPGNDSLSAQTGDDDMTGGPGSDSFSAGEGNDVLRAADGEADTPLNGGPGTDTVYYDVGVDANPVASEVLIGSSPPPPPPPPPTHEGSCTFDAAAKTVRAEIGTSAQATLTVSGGAIWFGLTPTACGGATTTNTDTVTINGAAGVGEWLTIDESGGAFAPGATAETTAGALSEIEIQTTLGDAADVVAIVGTPGDDSISVGLNGVAINADSDADITFSPRPTRVEIWGMGGRNTLSGNGGSGAGAAFTGQVALRAGALGDTLRGGVGADDLVGGAGNDILEGRAGADSLVGAGGNDSMSGGDGNDNLWGSAGADSFIGGSGDDVLYGDDDEADTNLNGGPGNDTAYYDAGLDVKPTAVETAIPA